MEGIDLAKVVIGTPCNAYISEYLYKIKYVYICLHVFVSKKNPKA